MDALVDLAVAGLPATYRPASAEFTQTVRLVRGRSGVHLQQEGTNLRYAAIVALGLARMSLDVQRRVLDGRTADELGALVAERAVLDPDTGAVALAAWVSAEVRGIVDPALLDDLASRLASGAALPTVDTSWALTAAVASLSVDDSSSTAAVVRDAARERLLAAQGPQGLFPHALPADSLGRWRSHVGCFADQVYPIQALARLATSDDDGVALAAAERCAARIVNLQGPSGQWWWHYDWRDGSVVEGFPVYSVHQHAMAPMALFDLAEAGGTDHLDAVVVGMRWLDAHPEVLEDLVSTRHHLIWRKVGRREPPKAARSLSAATTSVMRGLKVPGLDAALPPVRVDHECRPYELGWLLYAWRAAGVVEALAPTQEET
ncbi:hypothetical protein ASE38_01405 [Cellulomonas sp. Root930]|nr:hypothetical protein ASE38_01405 [Cellulomonas sp. Root930]